MLIRTTRATPASVWVGERATIDVELLTPTTFGSAPTFDLPEIPGTLLMTVEDSPVLGTETVDGTGYVTQTRTLAFFAMRAGTFEIPPFAVRFASPPSFGAAPVEHKLTTQPLRIEARMPPGAEKIAGLISTTEMTAQEHWQPQPKRVRVGDAFTRTITRRAPDVPGLAFPPLRLDGAPGLAAYPAPPSVHDETERGAFTGTRIDRVTYVCERRGTVRLPAIELPWWNVTSQQLETVTLPGVTIEVAGGGPTARVAPGVRWTVGAVLLALAAVAGLRWRGSVRAAWERRRARAEASEAGHFARLEQACHDGDAPRAFNALLAWLDVRRGGAGTVTLRDDLLASHGDDELRRQVTALEDVVLHRAMRWDGARLGAALRRARRDDRPVRAAGAPALPALNPR